MVKVNLKPAIDYTLLDANKTISFVPAEFIDADEMVPPAASIIPYITESGVY